MNLLNVANYQTNFSVPATACVGSPVTFTDNSSPVATQRNWLVDGTGVGTFNSQSYSFSSAGTHTISLSNLYGTCPQMLTKNITVNAVPAMPPFDAVLSTPCGEPVTVNFLDHTPGAVKWAWIFNYQGGRPLPAGYGLRRPGEFQSLRAERHR
jgi:PKD repeat protein